MRLRAISGDRRRAAGARECRWPAPGVHLALCHETRHEKWNAFAVLIKPIIISRGALRDHVAGCGCGRHNKPCHRQTRRCGCPARQPLHSPAGQRLEDALVPPGRCGAGWSGRQERRHGRRRHRLQRNKSARPDPAAPFCCAPTGRAIGGGSNGTRDGSGGPAGRRALATACSAAPGYEAAGAAEGTGPRVCILGGGFGGLYTAVKLESLIWPRGTKPKVCPPGGGFRVALSLQGGWDPCCGSLAQRMAPTPPPSPPLNLPCFPRSP